MSGTRTILLTATAVAAFQVSLALAQSKLDELAPSGAESCESVNKAWKAALKIYFEESGRAHEAAKKKGDAAVKALRFEKTPPWSEFSPRFLAVAERDPEGADAAEALLTMLRMSNGTKERSVLEDRGKAIKILHKHYVAKPSIKSFLSLLVNIDQDDARALVADVIARNPDRRVQVAAYNALIENRGENAGFSDRLKNDSKARVAREESVGKEQVAAEIARGDQARAELVGLRRTLREKYPEFCNDFSIGNSAPDLISHDLGGNEVRLSSLKGKVVVLDIWSTTCGPCKAMIPHEREMVGRLKGKPFELVSISVDEKKTELTDFLAKVSMPWTHWFDGQDGDVLLTWETVGLPTIYILDAQGIIRFKNICGEELEKAVNTLLEEAKSKTVSGA